MTRLLALLPVLIAFQAGAPPALAWTWPADGPVLRAFSFGDDPYAAGQHRGIDVAGEADAPVRAPAAGVVSFAGTVPGGGRTVTLQTADGYSVTLVHLGTIRVAREAILAEGAPVGTIGPTGDLEHVEPYVHLGIRLTSDAQGYLDPLSFLPSARPTAPASPAPSADPVPAPPPTGAPEPAPPGEAPAAVPVVPEPAPGPEPPAPAPEASDPTPDASSSETAEPRAGVVAASGDRPTAGRSKAEGREAGTSVEVRDSVASSGVPRVQGHGAASSHAAPLELPELPVSAPSPGAQPVASASAARDGRLLEVVGVATAVATLLSIGAALALRRRQLGHAVVTHAPAPVLEHGARRAAEDAGTAGPAQQDGLVLDRDLERVALGEPESLPDLDGNDDPAELVQMPNDACGRSPATVALVRFHRLHPHPRARCRGAATVSTR
jgi:Peptidase family M23